MSEYKTVKLGDVFSLQMGKTPARNNPVYWKNAKYSWISIADISKSEKYICETKEAISEIAIKESGIKLVPKNTIIMSFKLSLGKTVITKDSIFTNEAIMAFIPKDKLFFDISYLYHFFSNKDWSIYTNKAVKGVALNKEILKKVIIRVPNLISQKNIANKLDKITSLIQKRKKQLFKLDELAKSQFIEIFGDNKYPKEEISYFIEKKLKTVKEIYSRESEISYVDIASIDSINNRITTISKYFLKNAPSRAKSCIVKGDILISTVRPNLKKIALNDLSNLNLVASSGFCVLRPKKCSSEFLLGCITSNDFTYSMIKSTTGANYPAIKNLDILNYKIPNPPEIEIKEYSSLIQQLDKSKFMLEKSLKYMYRIKEL